MKKIITLITLLFSVLATFSQSYILTNGHFELVGSDTKDKGTVQLVWPAATVTNTLLTTQLTTEELTKIYSSIKTVPVSSTGINFTGDAGSLAGKWQGSGTMPQVNQGGLKGNIGVSLSDWATEFIPTQNKNADQIWTDLYQIPGGTVLSRIASITAFSNLNVNGINVEEGHFTEQHDVDNSEWYRADFSRYAKLGSDGANANPSLILFTSSTSNPQNMEAEIALEQKSGTRFGIFIDGSGATVGWNKFPEGLRISASKIYTTADFLSTGVIQTSGLIALNSDPSNVRLTPNTLGYFGGNSDKAVNVEISNQFLGTYSTAALKIDLYGTSNSLGAYSNNSELFGLNAGSFVLTSRSPNGIVLNALANNSYDLPEIAFAVNSRLIVTMHDDGLEMRGLTTEQILAKENPHEGLEIYNKSIHEKCFFNGTKWMVLPSYLLVINAKR